MQDRIIAVTGAQGAVGRVVVSRLATAGVRVAAVDIAPAIDLPDAALAVPGVDIARPEEAERAVQAILDRFGRIDGLVNLAGGFRWQTVADGDVETWDLLYRMNLSTALMMCRAALPALVEARGAIVNIGAASAVRAEAGMGAYAASKSAVARLTESLAAETKELGVRVNAILPGVIDTPANRADMPGEDFSRWVRPDELAEVVAFLCSDAASAITGALLPVTGRS